MRLKKDSYIIKIKKSSSKTCSKDWYLLSLSLLFAPLLLPMQWGFARYQQVIQTLPMSVLLHPRHQSRPNLLLIKQLLPKNPLKTLKAHAHLPQNQTMMKMMINTQLGKDPEASMSESIILWSCSIEQIYTNNCEFASNNSILLVMLN